MAEMVFGKCSVCGKYRFGQHRCPPLWYVRIAEDDWYYDGDEPRRIYAIDAQDAAQEFGELWDNGDYVLFDGNELKVLVSRFDDPEHEQAFMVGAEMVPVYEARSVPKVKEMT